jgi:hypothetical protein
LDVPQRSVVSVVASVDGRDVTLIRPHTVDEGTATLRGTVPELASGTFPVRAEVTDGIDIVRTAPVDVRIRGVTPPSPSPPPTSAPPTSGSPAAPAAAPGADGGGTAWALVAVAVGAGIVAGVALGAWWRSRRRGSSPGG